MNSRERRWIAFVALGAVAPTACAAAHPLHASEAAIHGSVQRGQSRAPLPAPRLGSSPAPVSAASGRNSPPVVIPSPMRSTVSGDRWSWAKFATAYDAHLTTSGALRSWMPGSPPTTFTSIRTPDTPAWIIVNRRADSTDKRVFALQLIGDASKPLSLKRVAFTVPNGANQNATYNIDFDHAVSCFDLPPTETARDTANTDSYRIELRHPATGEVVVKATKTASDAIFDFLELDLRWQPTTSPFASVDISVTARAQGEDGSLSLQLTRTAE